MGGHGDIVAVPGLHNRAVDDVHLGAAACLQVGVDAGEAVRRLLQVQPDAGKTYQVAICGVSDRLAAEATVTDSGVVGMDAAKAFFGAYTTISRADTAWS